MVEIVAGCPRKLSEAFMTSSDDFHAFHSFGDIQRFKLFFENSMWSNLKTKVNP